MNDLITEIEASKITCPCCLKERKVKNTPLMDIFLKVNATDSKQLLENEYLKRRLQKYFDFKAKTKDLNQTHVIYHTLLWACNSCISRGKAIVADFSKQKAYGMGGPIEVYVDLKYICRNCQQEFSFDAKEQKHWYEELGFIIDSRPVHCQNCRKEIRKIKNAQQKLMQLLSTEGKLSLEELQEIANYYTIIGAREKAEAFQRRIKNLKNQ